MIVQTSIAQLLEQLPEERRSQLSGQSIWVVGGGSGYGKAIALLLAGANAQVFVSGRNLEKLEATRRMAEALKLKAENIHPVAMDMTDPAQVDAAVQTLETYTPTLHGLVLTAALPQRRQNPTPLLDDPLEHWHHMLQTNVSSALIVIRSALKLLVSADPARILCFTSKAGWADTLGVGTYNISKCALNSLVASLAQEFRAKYPQHEIQINAVEPGEAFTEMNQGSSTSPMVISSIALHLLTTSKNGPSGKFFDRDLTPLGFNWMEPYSYPL